MRVVDFGIMHVVFLAFLLPKTATADVPFRNYTSPEIIQNHKSSAIKNGPFLLDTSFVYCPSPYDEVSPSIAFDGVNYFVVWQDDRDGDWDLYGARVSQNGVVLDTCGIPICISPGDQMVPAVAFDGTNHLVVWEDNANGANDIFGLRVDTSGSVIDTTVIAISVAADSQRFPALAFDGTNYLVVWQDKRFGDYDVFGTRISQTGQVLDTSGLQIAVANFGQSHPSVTFGVDYYFVVWDDSRNSSGWEDEVYGARVDTAGVLLDLMGIAIGKSPSGYDEIMMGCVDFDGANYFIAMIHRWYDGDIDHFDLQVSRVDTSGVVIDTGGILVATNACAPSIAFDGFHYLIAWTRVGYWGSENDVWGTRVAPTGAVLDSAHSISCGAGYFARDADVLFSVDKYCVVWCDRRGESRDIYGCRIDTAGIVIDTTGIAVSVSYSVNEQDNSAGTYDGVHYFTVWDDFRASSHEIYGLIDSSILVNISTHVMRDEAPAVSWNGSCYLVAWKRSSPSATPQGCITTARVSQAGVVLDPGGTYLVYCQCGFPSISFDGVNHLIVFHRLHYSNYAHVANTIRGLLVNQENGLISHFAVQYSSDWEYRTNPVVAFDGSNYLVVYYTYGGLHGIYGKRVTPAGAPIGPEIQVSNSISNNPAVAFDGILYLVVWESNTDIFGRFVDPSGNVIDSTFTICAAVNSQAHPAVEFDGAHYWVAWQDHRNGEWDIYGARVDTAGNVLEEFPVSLQTGDQVEPAIARGPDGQLLITYSGWTDSINGQPANTMRIWGKFYPFVGITENTGMNYHITNLKLQIYPNPVRKKCNVKYTLSKQTQVKISLFDVTGRLIKGIINEHQNAGFYHKIFDISNLAQGIYFIRLNTDNHLKIKKIIFVK